MAPEAGFEERVRASFARQAVMGFLGATMERVEPGLVEIALPVRPELTQQHGYVHAGIATTIADSAGGFAAYSLMPAGSNVLSTEFKLHFLAPLVGERLVARGQVVRAGRTLTVCELGVRAFQGSEAKRCVWGSQTLVCVPDER